MKMSKQFFAGVSAAAIVFPGVFGFMDHSNSHVVSADVPPNFKRLYQLVEQTSIVIYGVPETNTYGYAYEDLITGEVIYTTGYGGNVYAVFTPNPQQIKQLEKDGYVPITQDNNGN